MCAEQPYDSAPIRLGVNIDHVATLRNARGGAIRTRCAPPTGGLGRRRQHHGASARGPPPYPRRRHRAPEAPALRARSTSRWRRRTRWSAFASRIRPHAACLVPEKREERTTEGGLDIVGGAQPPRAGGPAPRRRRHPRLPLRRARDRGHGGGPRPRRAGGRAPHRRLLRGRISPATRNRPGTSSRGCGRRPRTARRSGSRSMPATASPSTPRASSPRSRRSSSSISAIS